MASYYVWSGATGSANGTSWANAYTTLTAAFSGKSAGDVFYVAHDHAESTAGAITLNPGGTPSNPSKVICANRAGSVPPVSADRRATASVVTTGNADISFNASVHYDGIIFIAGNSTGNANIYVTGGDGQFLRFDNCSLCLGSTSGSNAIVMPSVNWWGTYYALNNTTASFSAAGQKFSSAGGMIRWTNTPTAILGTAPTILFDLPNGSGTDLECIGVDLSAMGSGCTLVGGTGTQTNVSKVRFVDCKLNAAVTVAVAFPSPGCRKVDLVRSSATGNYAVTSFRYQGTLTEETTIVRTGGASDGITPISWKIVTTANNNYSSPFECPPIAIWNETIAVTRLAVIEGIWGGGAVPLDNEVWVDVEYLGSSSSPLASFVNDGTPDLLTTPANQSASSATWGGSTTKFKLEVTFTPQQKGWIYARVKVGKASSTFYIDPKITVT